MSEPRFAVDHYPAVRRMDGPNGSKAHYIVCSECGMLLWFVPLEELGIETSDWSAEQVPPERPS